MSRTINLTRPLTGHDGEIREVRLREPVFRDIMKYGQPFTVLQPEDGDPVIVEDDEKMLSYAEVLITEPKDPLLLQQLGVADTFKIRNAIIAFFLVPAPASGDSQKSPTTSSSSSESPSATSRP